MFDTNNFNSILKKSHPHSFFEKFHSRSRMAEWVFGTNPCLKKKSADNSEEYETYMEVVVLQVLYLGNNELLCELVNKEDFENNK